MTTKEVENEGEVSKEAKTLAKRWIHEIDGMRERGAAGRIIIAGNHLGRPDLDLNWQVVALAMQVYGSRPSVFVLKDAVAEFFGSTRPLGKPVTGKFSKNQGWRIRKIYEALDIPIPEGRSSSSLPDVDSEEEDSAEIEAGCRVFEPGFTEVIVGLMPSHIQAEEGEEEQATEDECEEATMLNRVKSLGIV
ncbi:unnamed protein product [Symbiodinium sp. CCMP2592]|nr:unnamed protein product [Symbiodinium sp. CCMP2592]